jgi:hypothetical protein
MLRKIKLLISQLEVSLLDKFRHLCQLRQFRGYGSGTFAEILSTEFERVFPRETSTTAHFATAGIFRFSSGSESTPGARTNFAVGTQLALLRSNSRRVGCIRSTDSTQPSRRLGGNLSCAMCNAWSRMIIVENVGQIFGTADDPGFWCNTLQSAKFGTLRAFSCSGAAVPE